MYMIKLLSKEMILVICKKNQTLKYKHTKVCKCLITGNCTMYMHINGYKNKLT